MLLNNGLSFVSQDSGVKNSIKKLLLLIENLFIDFISWVVLGIENIGKVLTGSNGFDGALPSIPPLSILESGIDRHVTSDASLEVSNRVLAG